MEKQSTLQNTLDALTDVLVELRSIPDHGVTADQKIALDDKLNAIVHNLKEKAASVPAPNLSGITTNDLQEKEVAAKEIKEPIQAPADQLAPAPAITEKDPVLASLEKKEKKENVKPGK